MSQGMCLQPRESTKKIELSTLFQFPQDIPGYAGYRCLTRRLASACGSSYACRVGFHAVSGVHAHQGQCVFGHAVDALIETRIS